MKIEHPFAYRAHDLKGMFEDVNTFRAYQSKMAKQSKIDPFKYPQNDYLGDAFEFLTELMIKIMPFNALLHYGYDYFIPEEDRGLDAVMKNEEGKLAGVQIKYKSDPRTLLTTNENNLSNGVVQQMFDYGITMSKEQKPTYVVVTNTKGLHHFTENNMFQDHVSVINGDRIRKAIDNNTGFFNKCREIVDKIETERKENMPLEII